MGKDEEKTLAYIVLTMIKGFGPVRQNMLLDSCGSIEACYQLSYEEMEAADPVGRIGKNMIMAFVRQRSCHSLQRQAEDIMKISRQRGIDIVTREDIRYPARFKDLPDLPVLLYARGDLRVNTFEKTVGIVGARRCSREGKAKAISTAGTYADRGAAVISGMAKGIDSYAHTAVVKSHGYTIAVLGNGPDICYPKEHGRLYEKIAESGCVLSEYPPGTEPGYYTFPRRNRLIAALSDELYVIDAGRNSGTRSTVEYAARYGRAVYVHGQADNCDGVTQMREV